MTLAAAILLLGSSPLLIPGLIAQSPSSSGSSSGSSVSQEQPVQSPTPPASEKSIPDQPTTSSVSTKPRKKTTAKPARHKKPTVPANCDPAAPSSSDAGAAPSAGTDTPSQATGISEARKNCPPARIVVQKGGITEQSIQLAGGSGNDASQKRNAANQMLTATEENLKKISSLQLSTEQRDSATQIRQFVHQSKSALATGDLERAQTLAWKAKLLSDDLVNPGK